MKTFAVLFNLLLCFRNMVYRRLGIPQVTGFLKFQIAVLVFLFPAVGNCLSAEIPLTPDVSLTIVTQPVSRTDCEDHVVNFKVVISGGIEPVTFTWQRKLPSEPGFTDLQPGSPGISYPSPGTIRVANVGSHDNPGGSRYRVIISDISGSLTSDEALLTVNEIVDIVPSVAFPAKTNVILCEGADISYTVITSGTTPVSWQWKKYLSPGIWQNLSEGGRYSGTQSATLSITGATPAESGSYKVNITFHSSWTDCSVDSETRTRKLTVQGKLIPSSIINADPVCEGFPPPILSAASATGGSGNFRYQWQQSADNLTWTNVTGAITKEFQAPYPVVPLWYRVNAVDTGLVSCGSINGIPAFLSTLDCSAYHYRTRQSGSWQDRHTWETSPDGVIWGGTAYTWPTATMKTITVCNQHFLTVDQDLTLDEVTIAPGGAVTVQAGQTLSNQGAAADFSIHSTPYLFGSLLVAGNFPGPLEYRLYASPSRWTILSPPVDVQNGFSANNAAINFNPTTSLYNFGGYREAHNAGWVYSSSLPEQLTAGRGYVARTAASSSPEEGMISFSGEINGNVNDTISPMVYDTGTRNGWNAVGNPFTSAIGITAGAGTAENFLTTNAAVLEDTYGAVYVWNQTGPYDGSQQYYRAIGNSGYNFNDFAYYSGMDPDFVQVGQGFLINVRENAQAVFSGKMQVHQPQVKLKKTGPSWPGLILNAISGSKTYRTVVAFHEGMTSGLDKTFDVGLLGSGRCSLYTRLVGDSGGNNFEIQCLPDDHYAELSVPLGLDLPESSTVTFRVTGVILPFTWFPVLEDRYLKRSIPLLTENDHYQVFLPNGSSGTGRFFLRFGKKMQELQQPESRFMVWSGDGKIRITSLFDSGIKLTLFDLSGRKLAERILNAGETAEFQNNGKVPEIVLLKICTEYEVFTHKFLRIK